MKFLIHKFQLEALDRSLRDIMSVVDIQNKNKCFGGKNIIFAGDFRQVLPVVRHGTRADFVSASPKHCDFWTKVEILNLNTNMRIMSNDINEREFAENLLKIGNGTIECNEENLIQIDEELLVPNLDTLISHVWPSFNISNLFNRVILAPKNEEVDFVNNHVLNIIEEDEHIYYSADTLSLGQCETDFPTDFLNSLNFSSIPPHKLIFKKNVPVILLRNICPNLGLCNGTRLICKSFYEHVIEAKIATGMF